MSQLNCNKFSLPIVKFDGIIKDTVIAMSIGCVSGFVGLWGVPVALGLSIAYSNSEDEFEISDL